MAKANNTTTARDTYQEITDKIVQALEAGTVPWEKPWRTSGALATPHNPLSGTRYRGINPVLLWMAQLEHGYASAQWATYRQIEQAGGQVRKGEPTATKPAARTTTAKPAAAPCSSVTPSSTSTR